jgi:hypothetical protein
VSDQPRPRRRGDRRWVAGGLVIAALVVVVLAPLAAADPDGLERVAEDQGFLAAAEEAIEGLLPDYTIPGLDGGVSTILAGLIGVALVFVLLYALGRVLVRRR